MAASICSSPTCTRDVDPHVRVHVGDEQIDAAIPVEVEGLHPHGAPQSPREVASRDVAKPLATLVQPEVMLPWHVENVQLGKAIVIVVDRVPCTPPAPFYN